MKMTTANKDDRFRRIKSQDEALENSVDRLWNETILIHNHLVSRFSQF
jgi:hypothetical protein